MSRDPVLRMKIFFGVILILLPGIGFNAMLNWDQLMTRQLRSALSPIVEAAGIPVPEILKTPLAGQSVETIFRSRQMREEMERALEKASAYAGGMYILGTDTENRIRFSSRSELSRLRLPEKTEWHRLNGNGKSEESGRVSYAVYREHFLVRYPVPSPVPDAAKPAAIVIGIPKGPMDTERQLLFQRLVNVSCMTGGICAVILFLALPFVSAADQADPERKMSVLIFTVVFISQLTVSGWILREHLLMSGFMSGHEPAASVMKTLIGDLPAFFTAYRALILDTVTVLIISVFFLMETQIFLFQFLKHHRETGGASGRIHYTLVRPVIFLLMFGVEMSLSFVPLYMEQLYEPLWGLSKKIVLSLPVSVSVFFTGTAFLVAGVWTDRRGWHPPFFAGILLAGIGLLYAWQAPDAMHFIMARAVSGTGYGLFFMAAQGFIIRHTDRESRARGFASLFASLYSGIICGNATGAMLAERIGCRPVFLTGAVIVLSAVFYNLFFLRHTFKKPERVSRKASDVRRFAKAKILPFVTHRNVVAVTLFSSIPANMASIGFLSYFNPVYLNHFQLPTADIGRIFMIYGFFMIYGGPFFSRYVDRSSNKKWIIVFGGITGSAAFLAFYCFSGLTASLAAVFFLGLSQSFVFVTQAAYLLKQQSTREVGEGMAVGTFRAVNRLGQAAGPLIFGWMAAVMSFRQSAVRFGAAYLFITLLFLLVAQKEDQSAADG